MIGRWMGLERWIRGWLLNLNWAFFWGMLLASLCFGALGVLIGLLLRSFDDQALVSEFILVPMTFLSGTLIPVERLPGLLQHCVWLFPLTPATQLLRSTLTAGGADAGQAALMGGWTLALFLQKRFLFPVVFNN